MRAGISNPGRVPTTRSDPQAKCHSAPATIGLSWPATLPVSRAAERRGAIRSGHWVGPSHVDLEGTHRSLDRIELEGDVINPGRDRAALDQAGQESEVPVSN
jgi:hypothetical protein